MKLFLTACIALMFVAGIYGASDMTHDLYNKQLINYDGVRARHAKMLLFVIKTTGLGTYKFRGSGAGKETVVVKIQKQETAQKKEVVQYFEEFTRGDE